MLGAASATITSAAQKAHVANIRKHAVKGIAYLVPYEYNSCTRYDRALPVHVLSTLLARIPPPTPLRSIYYTPGTSTCIFELLRNFQLIALVNHELDDRMAHYSPLGFPVGRCDHGSIPIFGNYGTQHVPYA